MDQGHKKSERVKRVIQHAIDIFDLVEIVPATVVEKSISRQSLRPDILPATRYAEMGTKRQERAFALNSRVC